MSHPPASPPGASPGPLLERYRAQVDAELGRAAEQLACEGRAAIADLQRLAHQLAGSLGTYGFRELGPLARRLEDRSRAGDAPAALREEVFALRDALRDARPAATHATAPMAPATARRRVLCIEDDPDIARLLELALHAAGLQAESAASGLAGWLRLNDAPPDLLVLDLMLPELSGHEILARRAADARLRAVPVLVLSAGLSRSGQASLDAGPCSAVLLKPFQLDELLAEVRRLLGTGPAP